MLCIATAGVRPDPYADYDADAERRAAWEERERDEAKQRYLAIVSALRSAADDCERAGCAPPKGNDWCNVVECCADLEDFE